MNETDKYKHELADTLAPLISKEGLTDVTDWVKKNAKPGFDHNGVARSVAYILEATGDFQREELEDKSSFYVKRLPRRSFKDKFPTVYSLVLVLLGAAIGLATNYQQMRWQKQLPRQKLEILKSRTDALYDSVTNLQQKTKRIEDTLRLK